MDGLPRIRIILEQGEARAFDPFDRVGSGGRTSGKSIEELLNLGATLRSQSLGAWSKLNLRPTMLVRTLTQPALGCVMLGPLLASW